jgi:hypothetical protein
MRPDHWKSLIHPEDREWVLAENERVDRTGDPWHMEYRALTKHGRVLWARDHAVLIRGEHGEPDYWQGYYIDITEQKQAEEALRQALERERQALERERQAASELRALDEMKNTFLDAVSHELRTPLATVIGIALTLQRAGPSLAEEDTVDPVDRLVANAGKLDRLLADLLDLDRLTKASWLRSAASPTSPRSSAGPPRSGGGAAGARSRWWSSRWWPGWTRARSSASLRTCSPTPPGTPPRTSRCGSRSHAGARACCWRSRTPGAACHRSCGPSCSSPSAKDPERPPTRRGRHRPLPGGPLRRAPRRAGVGAGPTRRRRVVPSPAPRPADPAAVSDRDMR